MFSFKNCFMILAIFYWVHFIESMNQNIINFRDFDTQYNRDCTTQLLRAMEDNDYNLVKNIIKDYNLNTNATNMLGESLLHLAACNNLSMEIIKTLVECGIDVNAQDNAQRTALHRIWYNAFRSKAVNLKNYFEKSFFLAKLGTDVHIFDRRNLTCLDLAHKVSRKCFNPIHDKILYSALYDNLIRNPKFYYIILLVKITQLLFITSAMLIFEDIDLYPYFIGATVAVCIVTIIYTTYLLYKVIDTNSLPCSKVIYLDNIGKSLTLQDSYSKEAVNLIRESLDQYIDGDINLDQLKLLNNNLNNNLFSKVIDLIECSGSLNCYIKSNKLYNKKIWYYFVLFSKNSKFLETYLTKKVKKFLNNIDKISDSINNKFQVPSDISLKIVSYLDNDIIKGLNA